MHEGINRSVRWVTDFLDWPLTNNCLTSKNEQISAQLQGHILAYSNLHIKRSMSGYGLDLSSEAADAQSTRRENAQVCWRENAQICWRENAQVCWRFFLLPILTNAYHACGVLTSSQGLIQLVIAAGLVEEAMDCKERKKLDQRQLTDKLNNDSVNKVNQSANKLRQTIFKQKALSLPTCRPTKHSQL